MQTSLNVQKNWPGESYLTRRNEKIDKKIKIQKKMIKKTYFWKIFIF